MKYFILFVVIMLGGTAYFYRQEIMNMFSKTEPQILETRDFECDGMEGFTFKYPVFRGWTFEDPRAAADGTCYIDIRSNDEPFSALVRYIKISAQIMRNSADTNISISPPFIPTDNAKLNPQKVIYDRGRSDTENGTTSTYFYDGSEGDIFMVTIELLAHGNFPEDTFWQEVIESFKLISDKKGAPIIME
ncbi:hypothetical protein HYV30_02925 [Candidatus Kaiserbacteria bacterium]|nr:hypothetical protein [Candidatus Kaiserbacteria bacterium]